MVLPNIFNVYLQVCFTVLSVVHHMHQLFQLADIKMNLERLAIVSNHFVMADFAAPDELRHV
jgi:hypothetical protein